jgi:hypothetical protein
MPRKPTKPIPCEDAPEALVELITLDPFTRGKKDTWPLASIKGGVDKMTVEIKGNTTIIKIVSPDASSGLDPGGWERPKREWRSRRGRQAKAAPA